MKVSELKEILNKLDEDREVYFTNCEQIVAYNASKSVTTDKIKGKDEWCNVIILNSVGHFEN
jgi:hypothetical protein